MTETTGEGARADGCWDFHSPAPGTIIMLSGAVQRQKVEKEVVDPCSWNFPTAVTPRGRTVGLLQWWMRKSLLWDMLTLWFFSLLALYLPLQIFPEEGKNTAGNFIVLCFICRVGWCCTVQCFTSVVNRMRTQSNLNIFPWIPTSLFAEF